MIDKDYLSNFTGNFSLKAHFSNIHQVIVAHLKQVQSWVVAEIDSFTDQDIFEVLCEKAGKGVKVSVALIGNEKNQGPAELNLPKGTDLSTFTQEELDAIAWQLNTRPSKSLGFKCPTQLFTPDDFDFRQHHASLFALGH